MLLPLQLELPKLSHKLPIIILGRIVPNLYNHSIYLQPQIKQRYLPIIIPLRLEINLLLLQHPSLDTIRQILPTQAPVLLAQLMHEDQTAGTLLVEGVHACGLLLGQEADNCVVFEGLVLAEFGLVVVGGYALGVGKFLGDKLQGFQEVAVVAVCLGC